MCVQVNGAELTACDSRPGQQLLATFGAVDVQ